MATARNAAQVAVILEHVAGTNRPLDAPWGLIEEEDA